MSVTCGEIISALSRVAPLSLQESWDNSGLQVGDITQACTGVLLALDPTPEVVAEAVARGCNMVLTHHPLLFRGLKCLAGDTRVEQAVIAAVRAGVVVCSWHTALDSAPAGVSYEMAQRLGAVVFATLTSSPTGAGGLGVVADLPQPLSAVDFVAKVKSAFGSHPYRCSAVPDGAIKRIAICGGSGGEFIPTAVTAGADAFITADVRYHDFVDHGNDIFIVDIGHFESENCAKDIFYHVITEKFPNFAVCYSELEKNPINYL